MVGNIKNSPWRGTYDAIVTDPPYSMRTALLFENTAIRANKHPTQQHQSTDPGSSIPSLSQHPVDHNTLHPSGENASTTSFSTSSTSATSTSALLGSSSILEDLISFASTHLVADGRLVFWWPEGTYAHSLKLLQ